MKDKKNLLSYIIILLSAVILICYIIFVDGVESIIKAFSSPRISFMWGGVLCIFLYWLFETIVLHRVTKFLHPQQKFKNTFKTTMIGQLFNCITPSASGGQPMQAFHMTKCDVPLGVATSSLLSRFILYQIALTIYSVLVLVLKFNSFSEKVSSFGFLVFIGFAVNTVVVLLLFSIGFFPVFTKKAALFFINIGAKLRFIKDKEKAVQYIEREITQFHNSFDLVRKKPRIIISMFIFSMLQLTAFFAIPFFVCLSMGVYVNIMDVIAASAFVLMISSFVPLPGASGGAEGSFLVFFGFFFKEGEYISLAILLWRIITFYLPIGVGMIFSARFNKNK
ncbi:MAG: flippase-like domain-containing protein [Clostridia bacterium]|nr:flippase-like domain-containing protein [Clostridia bacterium]